MKNNHSTPQSYGIIEYERDLALSTEIVGLLNPTSSLSVLEQRLSFLEKLGRKTTCDDTAYATLHILRGTLEKRMLAFGNPDRQRLYQQVEELLSRSGDYWNDIADALSCSEYHFL